MKIVRYESQGETGYGILQEDETVHRLARSPFEGLETDGTVVQLNQVSVRSPSNPQGSSVWGSTTPSTRVSRGTSHRPFRCCS